MTTARVDRIVTLLIVATAVIALVITFQRRIPWSGDGSATTNSSTTANPAAPITPSTATLGRWYRTGHRLGDPTAPVRIVEFGNYTCGFCLDLHRTFETLQVRYPAAIHVIWMHVAPPVDRDTYGTPRDLAIASECAAEQGRFAEFHHVIFARQSQVVTPASVTAMASSAGIPDEARFVACLDLAPGAIRVDSQTAEANAHRYTVTPTWLLNGKPIVGAPPFDQVERLVLRVLRPSSEIKTP